jgi:hypothetical protein
MNVIHLLQINDGSGVECTPVASSILGSCEVYSHLMIFYWVVECIPILCPSIGQLLWSVLPLHVLILFGSCGVYSHYMLF